MIRPRDRHPARDHGILACSEDGSRIVLTPCPQPDDAVGQDRGRWRAAVDSIDEAVALANDNVLGLTAGVYSEDPAEVQQFLDTIQAGVLYVNRRAGATTGAWPGVQAFGGWKGSGSTGKAGLSMYYVSQFMREQSRTIVD